jgi:hypothetical protein
MALPSRNSIFHATSKRVRDLPIMPGQIALKRDSDESRNRCIAVVTSLCRANVRHLLLMAKWKQYELWVQTAQNKWEIVGLFPTTELATVVANARTARTRLIEVLYDGTKMMGQEIIAELGNTRKE